MRAPYDPRLPLDGLTRRTFLACSGVAGASAVLAGAAGCTWQDVTRQASENPLPASTPVLVIVTLYGGNDGLNTVVPYDDPAYTAARPGLAYRADEVLQLDGSFGLNPGLQGWHQLWQDQKLAIVRGVGYQKPDRSHLASMDIWQTAAPGTPTTSGWLGRWLDAHKDPDPLLALSLGPTLPVLAVGEKRTAAALSVKEPAALPMESVIALLGKSDPADTRAAGEVAASFAALGRVRDDVVDHLDEVPLHDEVAGDQSLLGQLQVVAKCILLGAPARAYSVSLGGFDTHGGEKATQTAQLRTLDQAIAAFRTALASSPRASDVVIMCYSEFGRLVKGNASEGTDHGTAGDLFLIGDRVKPGFHGDAPSLTDLVDGDLKSTTDFRSVYSEVVQKMLSGDPTQVIGKAPAQLGVLR